MKLKTKGVSPKVYAPAIAQIAGGIVLWLFGLDVEGRTAIGSGIATVVLGGAAGPGTVEKVQA